MLTRTIEHLAPFDPRLNDAVTFIAGRLVQEFAIADIAPCTYDDLKAHLDAGKMLVVAREGSERTIFGAPEVNFAFRAWHDWCHWTGGFDFSLHGECATCNLQIEHLRSFFGVNARTEFWARLLIAEVIGQRQYFERYRTYIADQRAFARACSGPAFPPSLCRDREMLRMRGEAEGLEPGICGARTRPC